MARALNLPVQAPFLGKNYAALAKRILATPAYTGKTVLICWNHEEIPRLAAALGVTPGQGRPPRPEGQQTDGEDREDHDVELQDVAVELFVEAGVGEECGRA